MEDGVGRFGEADAGSVAVYLAAGLSCSPWRGESDPRELRRVWEPRWEWPLRHQSAQGQELGASLESASEKNKMVH